MIEIVTSRCSSMPNTMTLPILAPRPGDPGASITPRPLPPVMYNESQWAAVYPEIEKLYIHQRRKLRYVMQYMEKEHGFRAT